jgi:hypothetical protein
MTTGCSRSYVSPNVIMKLAGLAILTAFTMKVTVFSNATLCSAVCIYRNIETFTKVALLRLKVHAKKYIVTCMCDSQWDFKLDIGFIDHK